MGITKERKGKEGKGRGGEGKGREGKGREGEGKGREEEWPQYFPQHNCQMHDCEAVFYWWVLMNKSWPFVVAPYFVETNHNCAKIKVNAHLSYVKPMQS